MCLKNSNEDNKTVLVTVSSSISSVPKILTNGVATVRNLEGEPDSVKGWERLVLIIISIPEIR